MVQCRHENNHDAFYNFVFRLQKSTFWIRFQGFFSASGLISRSRLLSRDFQLVNTSFAERSPLLRPSHFDKQTLRLCLLSPPPPLPTTLTYSTRRCCRGNALITIHPPGVSVSLAWWHVGQKGILGSGFTARTSSPSLVLGLIKQSCGFQRTQADLNTTPTLWRSQTNRTVKTSHTFSITSTHIHRNCSSYNSRMSSDVMAGTTLLPNGSSKKDNKLHLRPVGTLWNTIMQNGQKY